ncbi:bile acid:sodium symporter family protein [Phaeocystidibacter luteus]|nr:bile acid:sodium symporter family protein [Phaeocystidibacter luteus]
MPQTTGTPSLESLDQLQLNLDSGNLLLLNLILGFVMFGVAIGIDPSDFKMVIKKPKAVLVGLSGQWLILPFLTILLIALMGSYISTGMAMGMILVASCPGGNISNFMVHHAKGNTALSVSLTAFSTVGSIILTPLTFLFWGTIYTSWIATDAENPLLRELSINPIEVGTAVFLLLGLPLLLGMGLRRIAPHLVSRLHTPMRWASILAFLAIIIVAFSKNLESFLAYIHLIFAIVLIHNAAVYLGGYTWSRAFKLKRRERRSIAIEMGIQNSGLGLVLLLNPTIFPLELPIGGMAAITAWWGIWHMVSGLSISSYWRMRTQTDAHE